MVNGNLGQSICNSWKPEETNGEVDRGAEARKFWASVLSLGTALGLLHFSDVPQTELVSAILTIVTAVSYTLATALEDAGRGAGGQLRE